MTLQEILDKRKSGLTENKKLCIIETSNEIMSNNLTALLALFEASSYTDTYVNSMEGLKLLAHFLQVPIIPEDKRSREGKDSSKLLSSYTRNEVDKLLGVSTLSIALYLQEQKETQEKQEQPVLQEQQAKQDRQEQLIILY